MKFEANSAGARDVVYLPRPNTPVRSTTLKRSHNRTPEQIRPLKFTRSYTQNALGSVLVEAGNTRSSCAR